MLEDERLQFESKVDRIVHETESQIQEAQHTLDHIRKVSLIQRKILRSLYEFYH